MSRLGNLSYAQKQCVGSAGKLMMRTGMIHPGARIGVAASGGMDSWALLKVLQLRQRITPFAFEIFVLHVNPGFDDANHAPLVDWMREEGVAGHLEVADHGPRAHSEENQRNSACFFCCRLRRKRLFELCDTYGLTHLALGHNADDLAATFFMNLLQAGNVAGMAISEPFFQGNLQVIRPMLWVEKPTIRAATRQWELPIWKNPCPSATDSARTRITDWINETCKGDRRMRNNILGALRRWQLDETLRKP